jgi:hypothetical protein
MPTRRQLAAIHICLLWCFFAVLALPLMSPASAAPLYNIVPLGLDDLEHTRNDGYKYSFAGSSDNRNVDRLNDAGQVLGHSHRYDGGDTYLGRSAWLYDGASTINIGLTGNDHTSSSGIKYSEATYLNQAGHVSGYSQRYNGGSTDLGYSAWLYDGTFTIDIGITDLEHTRNDDYRTSFASLLNEAGQVLGQSSRYNGGDADMGGSVWLYNGATTIVIGLTDAEHTRNDGYKLSVNQGGFNEAGQVVGYSYRYNGGSGYSAWFYNGATTINIGLTGNEHTRNNGYKSSFPRKLNEAGQVIGYSDRYNGGSVSLGQSAWLYDGATTIDIGLVGSEHTRSDGYKGSSANYLLNEAGQVSGRSRRFNGNADWGGSAWLYDGTATIEIGLINPEHTRNDGYRDAYTTDINEAGQVAGYSIRSNGGSTFLGRSAWLYDGATTIPIGLTGPEHTAVNGFKNSEPFALNEAGQVLGESLRFNSGSADMGRSIWLYDGVTTVNIGLTGPEHTRNDGYKFSAATFIDGDGYQLNEAGQVLGSSYRYNGGSTLMGIDAWFYDPQLNQTIPLRLSTRSDGSAYSYVSYLGEDGLVLGYYKLFDALDNDLGLRAFYFTIADGLHDLGLLIDDGFTANGWDYLANAFRANGRGQILGNGKLTSQTAGQMPYLLTPIVPEPSTFLLIACAAGTTLLIRTGFRRPRLIVGAAVVLYFVATSTTAQADTFGSGANTFDIEFVTIGNPGNPADFTGDPAPAGSVSYNYRIGKYEISEQMIDKANAEGGLGILKFTRGAEKPATQVSWNEAARFVNWLNTSTGNRPAYKFAIQPGESGYDARFIDIELWTPSDAGYDPNNLYRNSLARYVLPSFDEWYKAAYYDPISGVYYDYPTGSNIAPTPVASGTAAGTTVYGQPVNNTLPADINLAGGLSPYGTMGQGGNVREWQETAAGLSNNSSASPRVYRGGYWGSASGAELRPTIRFAGDPRTEGTRDGFRVASAIPEPNTFLLFACTVGTALVTRLRFRRPRFLINAAIVVSLAAAPTIAHAATLRTVALSGQQAPGTPDGVNFVFSGSFVFPVLNDAGRTAFGAYLVGGGIDSTNNEGIWSEGTGSLALVARKGSPAPGTPYNFINLLSGEGPVLNEAGQTAFTAYLTFPGGVGIWSEGSGSLALVARSGDQAPGLPSGANFGSIYLPALNNAGQTQFRAGYYTNGSTAEKSGIWSEGSGNLALVAAYGMPIPGTDVIFYDSFTVNSSSHSLNDAGQSVFRTEGGGIWSDRSGSLEGVGPAPAGTVYGTRGYPAFNNAGQVAFSDTNNGVWSDASGTLALVARLGSKAPGMPDGVNFASFNSLVLNRVVMNNAGHTAFSATTTTGSGVWSEGSGSLALVAHSGNQAPGTPIGVNFGGFTGNNPSLNDAGQTAFQAGLTGSGVSPTNNFGIWATDLTGALQLIARTGDLLEVGPCDFRTISLLRFRGETGNSDGRPSAFNNQGQLAFFARFTDGTSGIFVSNRVAIPEPSTILLLACTAGAAVVIRRWPRRAHLHLYVNAGLVLCLATTPAIAEAAALRTVALSGQPAPGTSSGVNYNSFSAPVLNDAGQAAFLSNLSGYGVDLTNDRGFWSEGSGSLALVAREGEQAPGTPSGSYYQFFEGPPVLNDAGQTAFRASLMISGAVNSNNDEGIWSEGSGSLAIVAREGDQAPGTRDGVKYYDFNNPVLNNAGQTAFYADLRGGDVHFDGSAYTNNQGIWSEGYGSLALVARTGSQPPGMASTVKYQVLAQDFVLNDAGQTAFWARTIGGCCHQGIWSDRSGSLALIVHTGSQAPDTPSGVNYSSFFPGTIINYFGYRPALNNAGQTAFRATLIGSGVDSTNNSGIWSEGSGSLAIVAREGDQAPGTPNGVKYGDFLDNILFTTITPALNNAGHTAFHATLTGSGVDSTNNNGVWSDGSGSLVLVARTGSQAPGTPNGVNFQSFSLPALNDAGQTAFHAMLTGSGVDSTNNAGIWATDRIGALRLIARSGDALEVAPGDFRTISGLSFVGIPPSGSTGNSGGSTGNSDGRPSAFNNSGQLAFAATFTDGTSGIFVSNRVAIPEPGTILLLGFAAGAAIVVRARVPRPRFLINAAIVLTLVAAPTIAHAATLRTVALSGQQAPGTPSNVTFAWFTNNIAAPVLNDAGQTAFRADLSDTRSGIWSEGSGNLALVARKGSPAPGTSSNFSFLSNDSQLVLNDAGLTAFINSTDLWSEGTGTLALVNPHTTIVNVLNNAGQSAFRDAVGTSGSIWSQGSGTLAMVASVGQPAPGAPGDFRYFTPIDGSLAFNDAGQTAFWAGLSDDGSVNGIWSDRSGSLALVARTGIQAVDLASGVNYSRLGYPGLDNAGKTAFSATLAGSGVDSTNNSGIWSDASGSLELLARSGSQAPGMPSGVNFTSFDTVLVMNNAGQIAVRAGTTGGSGLWLLDSDIHTLMARSGSQAPGTPTGVNFLSLSGNSTALNDAGQIAFSGTLTGSGVNSTNNLGIWATDRSGELQLIVRKGDQLEVAPGDFRTISALPVSSLNVPSTGNSDGRRSTFNNSGQLVFFARFTDGTAGIFVSNRVAIPEPGTLLLGATTLLGLFALREAARRSRGVVRKGQSKL